MDSHSVGKKEIFIFFLFFFFLSSLFPEGSLSLRNCIAVCEDKIIREHHSFDRRSRKRGPLEVKRLDVGDGREQSWRK
jgi:hypothetical protein